jgi:hypothetical protein
VSEAPDKKNPKARPGNGGARPGAGRKKLERPPVPELDGRSTAGRVIAQRVLDQVKAEDIYRSMVQLEVERLGLNAPPIPEKAIAGPYTRWHGNVSIIPLTNLLRYLDDRAYGRPMDTVNHLHDKPIEMNHTLTLGEGMRLAMQKAEERVRNRK